MERQNEKELEIARLFQAEELEERMEFAKWTLDAVPGDSGQMTMGGYVVV